jgi:tryptophan synthase alpha chain
MTSLKRTTTDLQKLASDGFGSGVERIARVFKTARSDNRAALLPYLTLGYPTPSALMDLAEAVVGSGADILELGIPFSDPLADGPVVQQATQIALQQGITTARCLEMAHRLRMRGIMVPFVFMGYYNPILAFGEEAFCRACRDAKVDGLIVPDLPPEEDAQLVEACRENELALIYLLAPTSTPERIQLVTERSQGFVYLVSVTGVTGARKQLPSDLARFVSRVRSVTDKPLAVGFGISTPEQTRLVARHADGVIVGSALLKLCQGKNGPERAASFIHSLSRGVKRQDDAQ